jgi:hypothetical protein
MNGNALIRILATFGLLVASLWVSFDIFTSGSNAVARFYMYALVVSGVYGLLNARKAFFVLIFLTGYLDFFKRFMIFDSGVSKMDLYYVLGIAPAAMCGIAGNILYQHFTGKLPQRPGLGKLIIIVLLATIGTGVLSITAGGDGFRALGDTVNSVIYIMLLFAVPVLFRTPEDIRHMLKITVIMYVPAVAYMLVHFFRGSIFDWEMDYVKSGLTIEIRQLKERVFRPFGTMNSAANASMVFSAIFALCCAAFWSMRSASGRALPFFFRWMFLPCIGLAMFATYSRTGWVFAIVAVLAAPMLKRRTMTLTGYAAVITAIAAIVLSSPYLLKHKILNEISGEIYEEKRTDQWAQTTNLSTLNDRLEGFYGLVTEPDAWTPFGLKWGSKSEGAVRSKFKIHDKFTDILLNYGFVTIAIGAAFIIYQLSKLHKFVFYEREPLARNLGAACLAIGLTLTSGGTGNGAQFMTYPVNFFIWLNYAVVISLILYARERDLAAGLIPEAAPETGKPQMRVAPARPIATPVPAHAKA